MCDQQRLRPACAYAQTDQSLEYSMTVKLLTEQTLEFLSLTGGFTGVSKSTLVKKPHFWKSHAAVHLLLSVLIQDLFTELKRAMTMLRRDAEALAVRIYHKCLFLTRRQMKKKVH